MRASEVGEQVEVMWAPKAFAIWGVEVGVRWEWERGGRDGVNGLGSLRFRLRLSRRSGRAFVNWGREAKREWNYDEDALISTHIETTGVHEGPIGKNSCDWESCSLDV